MEEIDHDISEIKKAAIHHGKNIDDHVHMDANRPWAGYLHDAQDLLSKAHHDVAQEEDNPTTRGLRDPVLSHIDKASSFVDQALGGILVAFRFFPTGSGCRTNQVHLSGIGFCHR